MEISKTNSNIINLKKNILLDNIYTEKKEGQNKIKLGSQDLRRRWKMKQEKLSPNYTCKINEVIKVR